MMNAQNVFSGLRGLLCSCGVLLALLLPGCELRAPSYTAEVERVAANAFEAGLIAAAEQHCADQARLAAACPVEEDAAACRWSCGEVGGFLLPYAITSEAIAYYEGLIAAHGDDAKAWFGPFDSGARLEYTASVEQRQTESADFADGEVYLVHLQLAYRANLYGFAVQRQVAFDKHGTLRYAVGDGRPTYSVAKANE